MKTALLRSGLVLVSLGTVLLTSPCSKSDHGESKGNPCGPAISEIAPATGDTSGGDSVTIRTSCFQDDFTDHTPDVFFGVDPASVTSVDADAVIVITPPHPAPGAVDVTVQSTGVVESAASPQSFTYLAVPCTIGAVRPDQGSTLGGQIVSIEGEGFDLPPVPPPTVEFEVGNPSPAVTVLTDTLLRVETPAAGASGRVDLIVTGQADTCTLAAGFEYITPGPCSVTAATPNRGLMDRTTTVYLTGVNFDPPPLPAPTVEFGPGNFATGVSVIASDRLVVDAPTSTAAGLVDVIVSNQAAQCLLVAGYEYLPPPPPPSCTITCVEPAFGPENGGTDLKICGAGFTYGSRVWIGGTEVAPVYFGSDAELQVTTPPGVGTVGVAVDIGGGALCDLSPGFDYVPCGVQSCDLRRANPKRGSVGELVTLFGSGFEVGAQVFFGIAPDLSQATVVDESGLPTELVVAVPPRPGIDRTVDIQVVDPSGPCCTAAGGFTYMGCLIESVLPERGTLDGRLNVLITGQDLFGLGLPEVWFGTEPSPSVYFFSPTELVAETPPAAGQTSVEVTVVFASGETCSFCCYTYYPKCEIDRFDPDFGGTNGGYGMTITGWGFDPEFYEGGPRPAPGIWVRISGVYADQDFIAVDPTGTFIDLIVPPSPTGGPAVVEVWDYVIWTWCTGTFDYILPGGSPCSVTEIDPETGWEGVGDWTTIRGEGFDAETGVLFGLAPSPEVILLSPQEIRAKVPIAIGQDPSEGISTVDLTVAPRTADPCTVPGGFTYVHPPCQGFCLILDISPDSGPVSGMNTVTLSGVGFCPSGISVRFGTEMAPVTYVDDRTLSVVVPPSVTGPGPVDVLFLDDTLCGDIKSDFYAYD